MKIYFSIKKNLFLFILIYSIASYGQINDLWVKVENSERVPSTQTDLNTPQKNIDRRYQLNRKLLKEKLQKNGLISFPNYDGSFDEYSIVESSNFSPALQKKYPDIKSYIATNTKDNSIVIRFSFSQIGLHTVQKKHGNSTYIEPLKTFENTYQVFSKKDINPLDKICLTHDKQTKKAKKFGITSARISGNNIARTYRFALSCTGEYAQFHLEDQNIDENANISEKKAAVLAAMNVSLTRLNGVFQKELAVKLELVENNDLLIFLDPETDGYTSDDDFKMIEEVAQKCNTLIGSANYDIGHLFNNGASGLAELASICTDKKAQAVSGRTPSKGDAFDIDFVAHEMGHQFGANHTFSNECGGNKNNSTAVEPGSGSTIMGYAGICAPNIQGNSDAYFHGISLEQMFTTIDNTSCATESSLSLEAPTSEAGPPKYIPAGTAFSLLGTGSSSDGKITYSWEQIDIGSATMPPLGTNPVGPLFRSLPENESPIRHFPEIATTLTGAKGNTWEQLPLENRNLNFKLTTRNNDGTYGQFATDNTIIAVIKTERPFEITSQNTTELLYSEAKINVEWNIGATTNAPINTSHVNILLSTDGGYTFPITLASNTPNDGVQTVTIPVLETEEARIKIEAVDNIFYDINNADLTIKPFITDFESTTIKTCAPLDAELTFTYLCGTNFTETTSFSLEGIPEGMIARVNPSKANTTNTQIDIKIENIQNKHLGVHEFKLIAAANSYTNETTLKLVVEKSVESAPYLYSPANFSKDTNNKLTFSWKSQSETNNFLFELAKDLYFEDMVYQEQINTKNITLENLTQNQKYYWRVKEINSCLEGIYSSIYNFTTGTKKGYEFSNNTETEIPDGDTKGINSLIQINESLKIIDLTCSLNIIHPYTGDIELKLIAPDGTNINLKNADNKEGANFSNTTFDDNANVKIENGIAPYAGAYIPASPLSQVHLKNTKGYWTLKVIDKSFEDEGKLNNWKLDIEGIRQNQPERVPSSAPKPSKAFSPNNDGFNDTWLIENIQTTNNKSNFPTAKVTVYNLQGKIVYHTNFYQNNWNGTDTDGNLLPIGTYSYIIEYSTNSSSKGFIYIKR